MNVGHHLGCFGRDQRFELLADRGALAFKAGQIGKLRTVVELNLGQAGIMEMRRFLVEMAGAARAVRDEALDAGAFGGIERELPTARSISASFAARWLALR